VEVSVTEGARDYIKSRGGSVYVRAHPHRCCTGALTVLDATTHPPTDAADFVALVAEVDGGTDGGDGSTDGPDESVQVRYYGGSSGLPERLTIELRGVLRRRPMALWDGCAYKLS
jgi:hypothetical protein